MHRVHGFVSRIARRCVAFIAATRLAQLWRPRALRPCMAFIFATAPTRNDAPGSSPDAATSPPLRATQVFGSLGRRSCVPRPTARPNWPPRAGNGSPPCVRRQMPRRATGNPASDASTGAAATGAAATGAAATGAAATGAAATGADRHGARPRLAMTRDAARCAATRSRSGRAANGTGQAAHASYILHIALTIYVP